MDDATRFARIFGEHARRSSEGDSLRIRDGAAVADLRARASRWIARDDRMRDGGWSIDFSPVRTDVQTERSMFEAVLTSPTAGTRHVPFRIGRHWIEIGDHPVEAVTRGDPRAIERALEGALDVPGGVATAVEVVTVEVVEVIVTT